jgi:hypothetical protein|tara:strand:+ start:12289 stop:13977 length:1689 start_codon:yes stop_codon:yes gene_type:complete
MSINNINTTLSNYKLSELNNYLDNINNLDKDYLNKIQEDGQIILNSNINNYLQDYNDLFINKMFVDYDIDNLNLNFFQIVSNDTNLNLLYIDFMIQFYKNIKLYIDNNLVIDDKIYSDHFTFNFKCKYKLIDIYNNGNETLGVYNYNDKFDNYYTIYFKLNIDFFKNKNKELKFYRNLSSDDKSVDPDRLFNYLFNKFDKEDLLINLDFNNKNTQKYYYIHFNTLKLKFNNYILKTIYYNYIKNYPNNYKFDQFINEFYNIFLDKNLKYYSDIKEKITILNNRNIKKPKIDESDQIFNAIKTTKKIKKINEDLEYRYRRITIANNNVSYQQKKLNYIKYILILTIIVFIISSLLLLSVNYLRNINYNLTIYSTISFIIILYIIVFWYINSIKIFNKDIYYEYFNNTNNNIFDTNKQNSLLKSINDISIYIITNDIDNNDSYYDMINPLLNNELKIFKDKEYNSKIYDKITNFNMNISNRDIKYNIETILYLINLSLLIIIIFIILFNFPNLTYTIGSIGIILFLFMSIIYFAKIIRIVRTKSYNYYWNKPLDIKKINDISDK